MSQLLVRDLDPEIVAALKRRAAEHGHSTEAEHREILKKALQGPRRRSFTQVLEAMPHVGLDSDFERIDDSSGHDVFN